jgi:TetR/AcrR family transcriptional regulator, transcriptional repressor for nem operon
MGHSQAEKARTHERIVAAASRQFREKGLDGIGLADLMKGAGVTVGGFYKHFPSRDALVGEAVADAFGPWEVRVREAEASGQKISFIELLAEYLEPAHRDRRGEGCVFAALAADLARSDDATRAAATEQIDRTLNLLARLLGDAEDKRPAAILAYSAMIGAISLARIATDAALSDEILGSTQAALVQLAGGPASDDEAAFGA